MRISIEPTRLKSLIQASQIFDGSKPQIPQVNAVFDGENLLIRDLSRQIFAVDSLYHKNYFLSLQATPNETLVLHDKILEFIDEFTEDSLVLETNNDKMLLMTPSGKIKAEVPCIAPVESTFPIKTVQTKYGLIPEPAVNPTFRAYLDATTLSSLRKSPKYKFKCDGKSLFVSMTDESGVVSLQKELPLKAGPEPPVINPFELLFTGNLFKAMASNMDGEIWLSFTTGGVEAAILSTTKNEYFRTYLLAAILE